MDHQHSPTYGSSEQLDAQTMLATCSCGERITQKSRIIGGTEYVWAWSA